MERMGRVRTHWAWRRCNQKLPACADAGRTFLFLDNLMNESRSNPLAQYLGSFRLTAQSVKKENQTKAQAKACERWKKPHWASSNTFNRQTMQVDRTTVAGARVQVEERQKA